ncbi:uncharacterized protein LOC119777930 isoform X1 [Cyprinodon tularosa]|uniref:uncharacterized protein LOC119777930 isoform X1 n=1 Tax=Cyprinodon tularosa TaxID=77115 RepID=UPI0018E203E4|nr:uncharacterized protein LOC119777930 isoform X1 [Cyprinodon tularosa]
MMLVQTSRPETDENLSTSSSSCASTLIVDRSPQSEYGEPIEDVAQSDRRSWQPCQRCGPELRKLEKEKKRMEDILCSIKPEDIRVARGFLKNVALYQESPAALIHPSQKALQELFPNSGLFLSSFKLASIMHQCDHDSLRLFHLLYEHFFTAEECTNAVAFGRHGKIPEGKQLLDQSKVDGILTYVRRCATMENWKPVEEAKLKKALINKCRHRSVQ